VMSHELYNCGHMYEAACAHHLATGKRSFLDVALRSAELICSVFGPEGRHDMCGHQIVEMGLARLYRATGDRRYLEQARFFLEQRGRHDGRIQYLYEENPGYCQDHAPVAEQREAVGHAVRAAYMYCGMADVAALLPDRAYAEAIKAIWRDVVQSKIYLTGAIGARHRGEAFGETFELPNVTAYGETCASIGSVMWNHRLFLLTGDARYVDVMEQTLYNRLLSGVSLRGDEYFYANPLESDGIFRFNHGSAGRQGWFDVSCCPTNISRFFPSLPGYVWGSTPTSSSPAGQRWSWTKEPSKSSRRPSIPGRAPCGSPWTPPAGCGCGSWCASPDGPVIESWAGACTDSSNLSGGWRR